MILKKSFTIDKIIEYKECFIDTEIPLEIKLTPQNVDSIIELLGDDFYPMVASNCVSVMQGIMNINKIETFLDIDKLWYEIHKLDKIKSILFETVRYYQNLNVVFGVNFPIIINNKNKDIIYKYLDDSCKIHYYYILLKQKILIIDYETFLKDFLENKNTYLFNFVDVNKLFNHYGYDVYTNGSIQGVKNFTAYEIKNSSLHELATCFYQHFRMNKVDAYIVPKNCENIELVIEKIKEIC